MSTLNWLLIHDHHLGVVRKATADEIIAAARLRGLPDSGGAIAVSGGRRDISLAARRSSSSSPPDPR